MSIFKFIGTQPCFQPTVENTLPVTFCLLHELGLHLKVHSIVNGGKNEYQGEERTSRPRANNG